MCRGGEGEKEEEVTVDTHGLTSYHILKGIRDKLKGHYKKNDFKSMVKEAEPLVQQVEEIEEEKHSLFREVMVMMMSTNAERCPLDGRHAADELDPHW